MAQALPLSGVSTQVTPLSQAHGTHVAVAGPASGSTGFDAVHPCQNYSIRRAGLAR